MDCRNSLSSEGVVCYNQACVTRPLLRDCCKDQNYLAIQGWFRSLHFTIYIYTSLAIFFSNLSKLASSCFAKQWKLRGLKMKSKNAKSSKLTWNRASWPEGWAYYQGLLTWGVGILPGSSDSSRSVHKKTQILLVLTWGCGSLDIKSSLPSRFWYPSDLKYMLARSELKAPPPFFFADVNGSNY